MTEYLSSVRTYDVRFPTSRQLDGSDAMNPFPDYSAAYVVITHEHGRQGYGLAFTVGRGNDVQVAAIRALAPLVVGRPVDEVLADLGAFGRTLTGDSQLRWLGPEKGVIHMAAGAIVNAVWDLAARSAGQAAVEAAGRPEPGAARRPGRLPVSARRAHRATRRWRSCAAAAPAAPSGRQQLLAQGYPAYTTTPGWLGLRRREAGPALPGGGRRRLRR